MKEKIILKCGCELERLSTADKTAWHNWYVITLCSEHKEPYYKKPDVVLKMLRNQIIQPQQ